MILPMTSFLAVGTVERMSAAIDFITKIDGQNAFRTLSQAKLVISTQTTTSTHGRRSVTFFLFGCSCFYETSTVSYFEKMLERSVRKYSRGQRLTLRCGSTTRIETYPMRDLAVDHMRRKLRRNTRCIEQKFA
jgi:hypothetical protein